MEKNLYLILENGTIFEGKSFGAAHEVTGELVFTTAMTGYLETLTDPSYYGQMVIATFPLIGNYGDIPADYESKKIHLKAYIVREWCQEPSNFRSVGNLDTFLKAQNVVGLYGIDTRMLTRLVREYGVMNAKIVEAPALGHELIREIKQYTIVDAVKSVSCTKPETFQAEEHKHHVILWDFGAKENICRELRKRGCDVTIMPAASTAKEILSQNPDGIMLSNGPGDPAENIEIINELKEVLNKNIPVFGICLGHQLLALSQGARTQKLKYGHRGANQPALDIDSGRTYITSQNHGYTVVSETLPPTAYMNFTNANDGTCEGVIYKNMPVFSVQFHPEACGGPHDTSFLFDKFTQMIEQYQKHKGGNTHAIK